MHLFPNNICTSEHKKSMESFFLFAGSRKKVYDDEKYSEINAAAGITLVQIFSDAGNTDGG